MENLKTYSMKLNSNLSYQCPSIMQPSVVIVEVPFGSMIRLIGEVVQLEEEG